MAREYRNDDDWLTPTLALAVWAAHFSVLWAASSIFPGQPAARWIAVVFTGFAFIALWWLWKRVEKPPLGSVGGLGIAIGGFGVALDVVPALIG